MLECHRISVDSRPECFNGIVRSTENLPVTFQFWMAYVARDLRRLGVCFKALSIMIQIPGAMDYRYLCHDDQDKDLPPFADDPYLRLHGVDHGTVLSVLAECLCELNAEDILKQIPEAKRIRPKKLSVEWHKYLNRESTYERGLLNVIAECLDELIVRPGIAEIDRNTGPMWWQDFWSRIEDC